jgi:hypothetical protein
MSYDPTLTLAQIAGQYRNAAPSLPNPPAVPLMQGQQNDKSLGDMVTQAADGISGIRKQKPIGSAKVYSDPADVGPPAPGRDYGIGSADIYDSAADVGPFLPPLAAGGIADVPKPRHRGAGSRGGLSWLRKKAGLVHSPTPGRADSVKSKVRRGSYVMPADIVSTLGEGNTMAGAHALAETARSHGPIEYARGGAVDDHDHMDVALSGGEFVFEPEEVAAMGRGDHARGSAMLDQLVEIARKHAIQTLSALPPPK